MDEYFYILIGIPIAWMVICLGYQLCNLIYIWIKMKLSDVKDKEYQLWD